MPAGFASVLTAGFPPGKLQRKLTPLDERFVKSVHVPGQIWLGPLNAATGVEFGHGGIFGLSSAKV